MTKVAMLMRDRANSQDNNYSEERNSKSSKNTLK